MWKLVVAEVCRNGWLKLVVVRMLKCADVVADETNHYRMVG